MVHAGDLRVSLAGRPAAGYVRRHGPLPLEVPALLRHGRHLGAVLLVSQSGKEVSPIAEKVFGNKYVKKTGELKIDSFTLTDSFLEIEKDGKSYKLEYGLLKNRKTEFSFGTRAKPDMMGIYEEGKYDCNVSGAWVSDDTFAILAHITDTYFGSLTVHVSFIENEASMLIQRSGQYVFEDIGGFLIAEKTKKENNL